MHNHEYYMRRALRLAALGRHASPNPMVGCVIVNAEGVMIGEGFHPKAGEPHAEIFALRNAGQDNARGATAYVTLEPCSHFGRTPPCANALLDAGIGRVVAAMVDPNPEVSGQGLARLRENGVDVTVGVCEAEARALNAAYITHRRTGMPWVVLKTAMTLDGKIATPTGDSRWISSAISRRAVHRQLRDRCDVIMAGIGTVLKDDPALTTRLTHKSGRNPLRVIVDSHGRLPLSAQVVALAAQDGKTLVATTQNADTNHLEQLQELGCQLLVCEANPDGRILLCDLMRKLGTRKDVLSVLVEGGSELAAGLLAESLIDRWIAYIAPKIAGGKYGFGPIGGEGVNIMADSLVVSAWRTRRSGPDIVIDALFG